jgi:hypothetical protein
MPCTRLHPHKWTKPGNLLQGAALDREVRLRVFYRMRCTWIEDVREREEVLVGWRRLHKKELHSLYSSLKCYPLCSQTCLVCVPSLWSSLLLFIRILLYTSFAILSSNRSACAIQRTRYTALRMITFQSVCLSTITEEIRRPRHSRFYLAQGRRRTLYQAAAPDCTLWAVFITYLQGVATNEVEGVWTKGVGIHRWQLTPPLLVECCR